MDPQQSNKFIKVIIEHNLTKLGINNYHIIILDEIDSTNKYALLNSCQLNNKTIVTTEIQTAGYGRNGKVWLNRAGVDVSVSFIYRFALNAGYNLLPLVIAVGINRVFFELNMVTKIKWPNDILLGDGTKVSGVLVESKVEQNARVLVIGIGLNNIQMWNRNNLLSLLVKHVDAVISDYQKNGFKNLRLEWLKNCIHYQKQISLVQGGVVIAEGMHTDLTVEGEIQIKDKLSLVKIYNGSQISLIMALNP